MKRKSLFVFIACLIVVMLSACTGAPPTSTESYPQPIELTSGGAIGYPNMNDFSPQPGDENWTRSTAKVTLAEIIIVTPAGLANVPPTISINVQGELPSACHQLRIALAQPATVGKIIVEVYSVLDPTVSCPETPMPFQTEYQLGIFAGGHYSVEVNGIDAGEFDSPENSMATPGGIISTTPGGEATPGPISITPGDAATGTASRYDPQPGDSKLQRDTVYINSFESVQLQSYPPQTTLTIKGDLPTPCHQLRAKINPPDSKNKIVIEVYSLFNPDMMCTQVLSPFEMSLPMGSLPTGHYTIWVNGKQAGEFDT